MRRAVSLILAALAIASCQRTPVPLVVAVLFENSWTVDGATLSGAEISVVKRVTLEELVRAFQGYRIDVVEAASARRLIRIEDTPYASPAYYASGVTYPAATASSVRADVLFRGMLAAAHCGMLDGCAIARSDLIRAFGRGLGATAAHELGHQVGLRFTLDAVCADCYDGTATSSEHFFGTKHWSPGAMAIMARTLPR